MRKLKVPRKKIVIISLFALLSLLFAVILPIISAILLNMEFGHRMENPKWMSVMAAQFEDLRMERSDFYSEGQRLAGYKYSYDSVGEPKALVVFAHGLGGGHVYYTPWINYLAARGYLVFSYDITGNANSEGEAIEGLPQGLIDLENAIQHTCSLEEYRGLPLMLMGHSWGGFCVAAVQNLVQGVTATLMISAFNKNTDILRYSGREMYGPVTEVLMPYVDLQFRMKFGGYAGLTALDGMRASTGDFLVVHSRDDTTVPAAQSFDLFRAEFSDDARFDFLEYDHKNHHPIMSDAALEYWDEVSEDFTEYAETANITRNSEEFDKFLLEKVNFLRYLEPNEELMAKAVKMFDEAVMR